MDNKINGVGISFGILSPTLNEQLDKQGWKYHKEKIEQFEKEHEAIP
jgi:hypothetical protein